jgi:two-component system CheB/CheR fusion protein
VNQELQAKVDELSRSNNDMKNLLNSTDIATLFLDNDLNVRRFTTPTARIIKLIPSDMGRPITDITSDLQYLDLVDDAREVLQTLIYKEKQVGTRDGRWFSVRIMPYRTLDNVIDGLVITFTEAKTNRTLEESLRAQADELRRMLDACLAGDREPCVRLNNDLTIKVISHAAEAMLHLPQDGVVGQPVFDVLPALRTALQERLVQALRGEAPSPAALRLATGPDERRFTVRVYAQRGGAGVALFFSPEPSANARAGAEQ